MQRLPRTVRGLGLVSLLNDASSEMIYPLLPAFLRGTLGAGPAMLGLVEGLAEAVATLLKLASGWLSDRVPRRKPLIVAGYLVSTAARPAIALAGATWHVLAVRMLDRLGKGTRGAPRDALLAEATPPEQRGRAFGFHRAMDHTGALIGPLFATAALGVTGDLRAVFALALVPGLVALAFLIFGVREPERVSPMRSATVEANSAPLGRDLFAFLLLAAVFTLGNSSDAFLLLRAQETGVTLVAVPALWSLHHVVKAAVSTPAGALSDRLGRGPTIVTGWLVYGLAYAGFALARRPATITFLFALYGLFHALTEGAERALVADLAGPQARGRAFGLYHAVTGAALLPASVLTGTLWEAYGAATALSTGAALAVLASLGLLIFVPSARRRRADLDLR